MNMADRRAANVQFPQQAPEQVQPGQNPAQAQVQRRQNPAPQVRQGQNPAPQGQGLSTEEKLEALQKKYDEMRADMDIFSSSSVDSLLNKIKNLASRPIVEFNKHEVLELLEALKNTARDVRHDEKEGYFRLTYEALRTKLDQPNHIFRSFLLPLLGDKDHEKILGIMAKVEKSNRSQPQPMPLSHARRSNAPYVRCYSCGKLGHIAVNCFKRRREQRGRPSEPASRPRNINNNK